MSDWYLYLVRCSDGRLYTGVTTDVDRRFKAHQEAQGAKYLRGFGLPRADRRAVMACRRKRIIDGFSQGVRPPP